jgi:hypothetical protein
MADTMEEVQNATRAIALHDELLEKLKDRKPDPSVMLTMALKSVSSARSRYEVAARNALADEIEWAEKDDQSGRVRYGCVRALTKSDENPAGLSPSAAQTAASEHPVYTAFKDECRKLANEKDAAVVEREIAARGFEAAVVEARAWIMILHASLAQPQITEIRNASGVYEPDARD